MRSTLCRRGGPSSTPLRLRTYLAPGLPLALFEGVARHLASALGIPTVLSSDPTRSGPDPAGPDPFEMGEVDLGFLCAPGFLWLADRRPTAVELVPAAFVFDDERGRDEPVYWADFVVHPAMPARSVHELRGARWVYNDPCSLSGYWSVLAALRARGVGLEFFASAVAVGSHHAALEAVERGDADCAAIDSNTLMIERRHGVHRNVRIIESFGPYPVQPIVLRENLAPVLKRGIASALLDMHVCEEGRTVLADCGVRRLTPIRSEAYDAERALVAGSNLPALGCDARTR